MKAEKVIHDEIINKAIVQIHEGGVLTAWTTHHNAMNGFGVMVEKWEDTDVWQVLERIKSGLKLPRPTSTTTDLRADRFCVVNASDSYLRERKAILAQLQAHDYATVNHQIEMLEIDHELTRRQERYTPTC